jgi:hypothetical protein
MSHPAGISARLHRTISRTRRRMRLRTTAPPSAFLMLNPKRLVGCSLARKKTVKWELDRRLPARYTASNSPRRTRRASRGNSRPSLLGREAMTSLLATRCQNFAAAGGLHARTETVRLGAAAFPRLISALWQSNPPLECGAQTIPKSARFQPEHTSGLQATAATGLEFISVVERVAQGQEIRVY